MAEAEGTRFKGLKRIGLGILLVLAIAQVRTLLTEDVFGDAVGVLELRGVITDTAELVDALDEFRTDPHIVGVVLRIDSPGGAVAPSQELYDQVTRLRATKPVVASLGNVAASGGYYVAAAANHIIAAPGTLTGSIGAIMSLGSYQGLAEKLGVSEHVIKSGRYKDIGHPLRPMNADERALLQTMVDDILSQFVDAVAKGRGMEPGVVRPLADGRLFSGAQAKVAGLVDDLGGLSTAVDKAWALAGRSGESRMRRIRPRRLPSWLAELIEGRWPGAPLGGGLLFLYAGNVPQ